MSRELLALVCLCVLGLLAGGAALWMVEAPAGYPLGTPPWWMGRGLPTAVVALALLALLGHRSLREPLLLGLPALPLTFAASLLLVFPASGRGPLGFLLVITASLAALTLATVRPSRPSLAALVAALLWAAPGAGASVMMQAPPASARPLALAPPWDGAPVDGVAQDVAFLDGVEIAVRAGLVLEGASPDGGWSLFSPGFAPDVACEPLGGRPLGGGRLLSLDVGCHLPDPAWAHLGTAALIEIRGAPNLSLSLASPDSPRVPFPRSPQRASEPATAVSLSEGTLRLVRGTRDEKGPWTTVATTPLLDGVVRLWLYEGAVPLAEIALPDYAMHASREPSPTAGWGLPQNAIEFRGAGPRDDVARIWVSYAATSLGRGYDTVGYPAGSYRSRVEVRRLGAPAVP